MATHSRILAWKIPWTEEPRGLQSLGLQRVGHVSASEHTPITLNILLNILTSIIFDLEMNSKSLFGGPGEGEKYFYNFWSKNIPSVFMKATFSGQGCILRKKAFLVPGTHHVLWVCTSGIPSALRLPSSYLLPFVRLWILCHFSKNIALKKQGCLLIRWTNPHQCFSQTISTSLLLMMLAAILLNTLFNHIQIPKI